MSVTWRLTYQEVVRDGGSAEDVGEEDVVALLGPLVTDELRVDEVLAENIAVSYERFQVSSRSK